MYNDIVVLVTVEKEFDDIGNEIQKSMEREVFAEMKSISQSEFYQAAMTDLKPEVKFVIADYLDYNGEKKLKHKQVWGKEWDLYRVIRTYRNGTELELTCRKVAGDAD